MRVIVAEDSDMNRELLMEFLEEEGVVCDAAENGRMALELFEETPPNTYDAILMDVRMPVMDGFESTRSIRGSGRPDADEIPIIAMSAYVFTEDVERGRSVGMSLYTTKPLNLKELCKLLNGIYRKSASF